MMEEAGGASITDMLVRNGQRHSLYRRTSTRGSTDRTYVLTVARPPIVAEDLGISVSFSTTAPTIGARCRDIVLSLGAIQTPKVLMHSGVGDRAELAKFGIPVVQYLPGVGRNLQDHVSFGCTWEFSEPLAPRNSGSEATMYWKSRPELDAPDLLFCQVEFPVPSERTVARRTSARWTMFAGSHILASHRRLRSAESRSRPRRIAIDAMILFEPGRARRSGPALNSVARLATRRHSVLSFGAKPCRVIWRRRALPDDMRMQPSPTGTRAVPPRWVETRCRLWTDAHRVRCRRAARRRPRSSLRSRPKYSSSLRHHRE